MPPVDSNARELLGKLLEDRRAEIAPRYADRMLFAVERMGSRSKWRTLFDLERAKRATFKPETLRAFERAYELEPGSLDRFNGELEPLAAAPEPSPRPPAPGAYADDPGDDPAAILFPEDRAKRWIWRTPDATEAEKVNMIKALDAERRRIRAESHEKTG